MNFGKDEKCLFCAALWALYIFKVSAFLEMANWENFLVRLIIVLTHNFYQRHKIGNLVKLFEIHEKSFICNFKDIISNFLKSFSFNFYLKSTFLKNVCKAERLKKMILILASMCVHSKKLCPMLHQKEALICWLQKFVLSCTIMNGKLHQKMAKSSNKSTKIW